MGSTIVNKGTRTPATQQKRINPQLVERAIRNGLQRAHIALSSLLDIGENYTASALSHETLSGIVLQYSRDAADAASKTFDESVGGIPEGIADEARKAALQCSTTIERLHDLFSTRNDEVQAMLRETVGPVIIAMVRPAGIHLERAVKLLGYNGAGYDTFTGESQVLHAPEHPAVTAANGYRAAAEAISAVHGAMHALLDLGEHMDLWPCSFITLGQTLMPLARAVDEGIGKVEELLPNPKTPQAEKALDEILKAMEHAQALCFFSKHMVYGEGTNYDDRKAFERGDLPEAEFWRDWTKDILLACLGSTVTALVHRIGRYIDLACEALGERTSTIDLDAK